MKRLWKAVLHEITSDYVLFGNLRVFLAVFILKQTLNTGSLDPGMCKNKETMKIIVKLLFRVFPPKNNPSSREGIVWILVHKKTTNEQKQSVERKSPFWLASECLFCRLELFPRIKTVRGDESGSLFFQLFPPGDTNRHSEQAFCVQPCTSGKWGMNMSNLAVLSTCRLWEKI